MSDIEALQNKEKMLTEKLRKLKSGELNAEYVKGRNRQAETIARVESQLREVKQALATEKPSPKLPTGAEIQAPENKPRK
jgi:hypothetical protein